MKIEIDTSDKEESEISSSVQNVRVAVMEKAAEFGVGDDVILEKFLGAIYENCAGIGYVKIYGKTQDTTYSTKNIKISPRHFATFDEARIEVPEF